MTKKIAFCILLLGTISSAVVFLGLTWDTQRQVATLANVDRLSDQVVAGKRASEKYNCNDCHTILGFGGYYAPDLTKVVQRVGEEGIRHRVKTPEVAFANSPRKMPNQRSTDQEITDLVAFFTWVGEINNNDWPPQDSKDPKGNNVAILAADASRGPALLVAYIRPVCALLAPWPPGASTPMNWQRYFLPGPKGRLSRGEQRMVAMVGVSPGGAVFQGKGCMNCHSLRGTGGTFGPAWTRSGRGCRRRKSGSTSGIRKASTLAPECRRRDPTSPSGNWTKSPSSSRP